jgi:hypothetical protein
MRTLITILFVISNVLLYSQVDQKKLTRLTIIANSLEKEIKIKQDSLEKVKKEIEHFKNQEYLSQFKKLDSDAITIDAICKSEGKLRKGSDVFAKTITTIRRNDTIKLTDYKSGYWVVNKGAYFGYLSELWVLESPEVVAFKSELIRQNEELKRKKEKEEADRLKKSQAKENALQKKKQEEYDKRILSKYGNEIGYKLLLGNYWIDMTDEMARVSLGRPHKINRSVGQWGVHEQWVYYDKYLYFENGKLTSYQNSN